jgi:hypothetical protein
MPVVEGEEVEPPVEKKKKGKRSKKSKVASINPGF